MTFDPTGTFDPAAPEAERSAWGAALMLNDPNADLDAALPDGMTVGDKARAAYRGYYEHRKTLGLPVFPTMRQQAAEPQRKEFRKIYSGLDKLPQNLTPEQWQQVDLVSKDDEDPQEAQARVINANFLSAMMGQEIPPEHLPKVRDAYARQLGMQGEVTHKALYQEISKRHSEDEADQKATSAGIEAAISKRLATVGKIEQGPTPTNDQIKGFNRPGPKPLEWKPTREDLDAAMAGVSERNQPEFRKRWYAANRELSRVFRQYGPAVERIVQGVEQLNQQGLAENPERAAVYDVDAWTRALPEDKQDREIVMAMLGNALSNLPPTERPALARVLQSIQRGPKQAATDIVQAAQAQGRQMGLESGMFSDEETDFTQRRALLLDTIRGQGMKLSDVTDNLITRMGTATGQSAWMFPAAFTGLGNVAIAESMAGQSIRNARERFPGMDEGTITNVGTASGIVQGAIERFSNIAGVKILTGKLPTFTALLNRANIASPAGRAVLGFAAGAGATGTIEYSEEIAQGATDELFQGLAADLNGIDPETDWGGYFKDWLTVAGPEQKETLLAVMGFGMIAGAGASFNHFKYGTSLQRATNFMRANGFTEAEARDVATETDPDVAAQKAAAALKAAQERKANDPAEAQRQAEAKVAFMEFLKAQNEAIARAGMPRVVKERNEFTEEDQFVFLDTTTGEWQTFETEEDALEAWAEWRDKLKEMDLDAIQEAREKRFIEFLTAEGQAGEDVLVMDIKKDVTPESELTAAQTEAKTSESDLRKAETAVQRRRAQERLDAAKDSLNRITARVEVFLLDNGVNLKDPAAVSEAMRSVVIKGKQFATRVKGQIVGYTVQLFNGREIQDIAEEFAESTLTRAMDEGLMDPEIMLANLRDFEEASGIRLIDPGYRYTPGNNLPILEGFSKLARGYLMSQVRSGLLPPEVAQWLEMQASLQAASVELAKELKSGVAFAADVELAGNLREAMAAGYLPPRLESAIKDALGLDPEAQSRRLQKRMEEQLAAEAMDGFPEISEEAKGRLPHPETLRANNHPLAGEVRRIWESLKKPTKRRTKDGKTVDRTTEANAYFLPIGIMADLDDVRQALNERGFAFESITDMLDALDASLSYGKPFYGTMSGESFSMGRSTVPALTMQEFSNGQRKDMDFYREFMPRMGDRLAFAEALAKVKRRKLQPLDDLMEAHEREWMGDSVSGHPQLFKALVKAGLIQDAEKMPRATVIPNDQTRAFQGAEGSPSVIGPASFAISAYHGTPHKVDKFRLDKIGTGEGAQAYGWGLYFAQAEKVGREYRDKLSQGSKLEDAEGNPFEPSTKTQWKAQDMLIAYNGDYDQILRSIEVSKSEDRNLGTFLQKLDYDQVVKTLESMRERGVKVVPRGNLYKVDLKPAEDEYLDWDKPLSEQSEKVIANLKSIQWIPANLFSSPVLDESGEFWTYQGNTYESRREALEDATGFELVMGRLGGKSPKQISQDLHAVGIRGIRYLDGNSRGSGEGSYNYVIFSEADIEITEENGQPVNLAPASYALSMKGILRLEEAVARRMTRGPDERAEFFEKLRNRLAATVLQLRESKRNLVGEQSDTERERNRIRDAMAEAAAVIKALPPEARGRVPFTMSDILEQDTERGQVNALIRLIDKADEALETVLLKEYRAAFETLLDLAKPDLRQNKQVRGRLTPETQKLVGHILDATVLSPAELAVALTAKQAEIDALEASNPETPEDIKASQHKLIELYQEQSILETFGAFSNLDAAGAAHAYESLQGIYIRGRSARKILDEARRAEIEEAKRELLSTLAEVNQAQHAEKMADRSLGVLANAWRLGMSSFHQVMEEIFPHSITARDLQDKVRKADRAFVRAKLDAKDRFDRFCYTTWNLAGRGRTRARNKILAELSTLRDDWGIELKEGVKFANEKLTEDQAAAILRGDMKTGWETDRIAMTSLEQALADFRMKRLKAQNEDKQFRSTVIRFQRLVSRGKPGPFVASDLQALYFLQLYAQEQYRPALDKYGFTADVMEAMERKLNPKARDLGDFLRDEYDAEWDRLNPVYRAIYGLNMPKIRNYAPGAFEHLDAKGPGTDSTIDPAGAPASVNAMSAGFTKARTHHMARPQQANALAKYWSHLEATEYFIAYAELVRDARQIFRNPEVRRRIEGKHGAEVAKLFSLWLDAIEVGGNFRAAEMQSLAEMTHRTLATQSAVGLAYNMGVLLKQLSASFGVMWEMKTTDAIKGMVRAVQDPGAFKAVWNSEAVQQRILAGISPEDRRLLDAANASPSLIMDLLEKGRLPIAWADGAFTTLGASVAYAYHRAEGIKAGLSPSQADAAALAVTSRIIERTAQPATAQDKSMAELTARSFGKFLFLFKSDQRQKLAIAMNTMAALRQGRISAPDAAKKLLWTWAIYGLSAEVMSDIWAAMSRDDDDEDRWAWQDYLASMIAGPVSGFPLIGSMAEWGIRATIGTKAFNSSPNPVDQATKIPSATRKLAEEITAEDIDGMDLLTRGQQLASAIALGVGAFDSRAAIVPAGLRMTRDAYGMVTNFASLFMEPTADDKALAVVREIAADQKEQRDGKTEEIDKLAKDMAKLPADSRAIQLAKLDKDTRSRIKRKLKAAEMTASETALSRLSKDNRKLAIEKITAGMTEDDRRSYLQRLDMLGID